MPGLADERPVVRRSQKVQEWGHDGRIKRQRRRQLHKDWPPFPGQAVGLSQKRYQRLARVLQLSVMRNYSRHLDGEPKIRRRAVAPLRVGGRGVRPVERRIDLSAAEHLCISFEVGAWRLKPECRRARDGPARGPDANSYGASHRASACRSASTHPAELKKRVVSRRRTLPSFEKQSRRQEAERHAIPTVAQGEPVARIPAMRADVWKRVRRRREEAFPRELRLDCRNRRKLRFEVST